VADEEKYFNEILKKYELSPKIIAGFDDAKKDLDKIIKKWAGDCFNYTEISGSYAKGTATTLGSDFDLFISIVNTSDTLKEIYNKLARRMEGEGYNVKKQNVSIGIVHNDIKVDLVPAVKQSGNTNDHSLYVSKKDTWIKTNIRNHVKIVKDSERQNQIKIGKIWVKKNDLEFPSILLEQSMLRALSGRSKSNLGRNFQYYLEWLRDNIETVRIVDPSNSNNVLTELLTASEQKALKNKSKEDAEKTSWGTIIW